MRRSQEACPPSGARVKKANEHAALKLAYTEVRHCPDL